MDASQRVPYGSFHFRVKAAISRLRKVAEMLKQRVSLANKFFIYKDHLVASRLFQFEVFSRVCSLLQRMIRTSDRIIRDHNSTSSYKNIANSGGN